MNNLKEKSIGYLLAAVVGEPVAAGAVEKVLATSNGIPDKETLTRISGIGEATANRILAVLELQTRYFVGTEQTSVTSPEDLMPRLSWLRYETQEHFCVVTLDSSNHVIKVHDLTKGLVNQCPAHPREVFKAAVDDNAVSIILAHNHPSGGNEPSDQDIGLTRSLCGAGKVMQIPVIDHLVVSKTGFTSICRRMPTIFESNLTNN